MTLQPDALPTRFTHHVWYDQPHGKRLSIALCGIIMPWCDSVVDPTCPVCRAILADHDRLPAPEVATS